jgi:hypothetical protein
MKNPCIIFWGPLMAIFEFLNFLTWCSIFLIINSHKKWLIFRYSHSVVLSIDSCSIVMFWLINYLLFRAHDRVDLLFIDFYMFHLVFLYLLQLAYLFISVLFDILSRCYLHLVMILFLFYYCSFLKIIIITNLKDTHISKFLYSQLWNALLNER